MTKRAAQRGNCYDSLGQRDRLEGADHVVGAFLGPERFVKAGSKLPVVALVIFVAIKAPHSPHHDHRADPVIPKIADEMKAEIGARISALKTGMIVNHD